MMKNSMYLGLIFILITLSLTGCGQKESSTDTFSVAKEIPSTYEWEEGDERYVVLNVETAEEERLPQLTISAYRTDDRVTSNIEMPYVDINLIETDTGEDYVRYIFEVYEGWWIILVEADGYDNQATYFEVNNELSLYSFDAVMERSGDEE